MLAVGTPGEPAALAILARQHHSAASRLMTNENWTAEDEARYLLIEGRRWRKTDPAIPPSLESELVKELMAARRAVGAAKKAQDSDDERQARARVQDAKLALGERGRAWWLPREIDAARARLAAAMRSLLRKRDAGKTICPSDAARIAGGEDWRELMPAAREVALELMDAGWLDITQKGKAVQPPFSGPIRLRRTSDD